VITALEKVQATFTQVCPGDQAWPIDMFRNINAPGDL